MKKIALDLDGVVFDTENLYRVYTEIYDVDVFNKDNLKDNTKRLFQDRYNWTSEECSKVYNEIAPTVLNDANVMTGADIVIKKLKDEYKFIVVTSRNDDEARIAKDKFVEMGLPDIQIFSNEHHKIDRLINEHVDYIIDDDDIICSNASNQGITALYFKNNASDKLDKDKVINVNNWGEIYKYLKLNK